MILCGKLIKTCIIVRRKLMHAMSAECDCVHTCMDSRRIGFKITCSGPISQNSDFDSNDASLPKKSWFQISVESV